MILIGLKWLAQILALLAFVAFLFAAYRTWQMENSDNQKNFLAGKLPTPPPDGFYQGSVPGHKVSWLGKEFSASQSTGINVFNNLHDSERYPFKTSKGLGVRDPKTEVLKIDYNLPQNPFWLRPVLDEIVQIAPGEYLGKLHLRLIPGFPFTLAYFTLKK